MYDFSVEIVALKDTVCNLQSHCTGTLLKSLLSFIVLQLNFSFQQNSF